MFLSVRQCYQLGVSFAQALQILEKEKELEYFKSELKSDLQQSKT